MQCVIYYASLFLCYRTCYWNLRTLKPMRRYAVHCRYIFMYYFQDSFGTCVYVYTCMHHRVCIIGCLPQSFLKSPPTCIVCAHVIPHSRKLSREKSFANFAVLWLLAKVFSTKLGRVVPLALQKWAIRESFLRSYFSPIHKGFLPQKFPAIQYIAKFHQYLSLNNLWRWNTTNVNVTIHTVSIQIER